MENIIHRAIEGGYEKAAWNKLADRPRLDYKEKMYEFLFDPLFWQALGKSCKWGISKEKDGTEWAEFYHHAMKFHEINLTEGWEKAIEYLKSITLPHVKAE